MADNIVNARIQLKNDIEEHWQQAENFVPRQGELIIYNAETGAGKYNFPRFKVGDGHTPVSSLPFFNISQGLPHTLTFGSNQNYVYNGSADVTVPVYSGVIV